MPCKYLDAVICGPERAATGFRKRGGRELGVSSSRKAVAAQSGRILVAWNVERTSELEGSWIDWPGGRKSRLHSV